VSATVIVPFHRHLWQLRESLGAIRRSLPEAQVVVAADGAVEDCAGVVHEHGATLLTIPGGPVGPATARNHASRIATGDLLLFVDTDVVPAPDTLAAMCAMLATTPEVDGVFGAYDERPPAANFASQFKNLTHAYTHAVARPEATTFWAGLGVVRRSAFHAVGGFDERFRRPSVEDIDLGYRLRAAGFRLRLDPAFRGTHLKRWTIPGCVRTDVRDRGIPWVQLMHRTGAVANDLNTTRTLRLAIPVAYASVAAGLLSLVRPWAPVAAVAFLVLLVALRWDYLRWFVERRGWVFGAGVAAMDLVHHLCNGVSLFLGSVLHLAACAGVSLPGALPRGPWPTPSDPAPALGARR
jgi:GT2 family glycosyltransferase